MKSIFSTLEKKLNVAFFFQKQPNKQLHQKKKNPFLIKVLNPLQNVLCFSISMQIMLFFLVEGLPSFHSKCVKHLVQECFFLPAPKSRY